MDYQEKIKQVLSKTSPEAQKIVAITINVERQKRWQEEHNRLSREIVDEVCRNVSELVK